MKLKDKRLSQKGDEEMKKVLVTGATGHVGNVLVKQLNDKGYNVYSLVLPHDQIDYLTPYSSILYGDILDSNGLEYLFEGFDYVIHCAGMIEIGSGNKKLVYDVNVNGTKNVLEAAFKAKVKRVVYTSSVHALPSLKNNELMKEIDHFDPKLVKGHYAKSKAIATQYALDFTRDYDLDVVITHLGSVIGDGDYKKSYMGTVANLYLQNKLPVYIKGGYNFVDVKDTANGIILALEKGKRGECYLLTGIQKTIKEYLDDIAEFARIKPVTKKINYTFILIMSKFSELFYKIANRKPLLTTYSIKVLKSNSNFSNMKAVNELGFTLRPFEETVADVVNFNLKVITKEAKAKLLPTKSKGHANGK